ncbi:hypothetical protein V6N13_142587 [Hibiscus sabdariffa]
MKGSGGPILYWQSPSPNVIHCDATPIFWVHEIRFGDKAVCGGFLVTKGGVVRALFSGPVVNAGTVPFGLCAVKAALETFKKAGWASRTALTIELVNRSLINRLENSLQRPWNSAKYFVEIDSLIQGCISV